MTTNRDLDSISSPIPQGKARNCLNENSGVCLAGGKGALRMYKRFTMNLTSGVGEDKRDNKDSPNKTREEDNNSEDVTGASRACR